MTKAPKAKTLKPSKKINKTKQKPKYEIIPYLDYLDDERKIRAVTVLAYSGYSPVYNKFAQGAITKAAKEAGVNRLTIYAWLKKEEFINAIQEVSAEITALAVANLVKMASRGNPAVCMFLAERTAPHIYSGQFQKFEHEKEMLRLKAQLNMNDDELTPPSITIIAQTVESPDYERNKLE